MRTCLKTMITPTSASLFIGALTAGVLFIVDHIEGNNSSGVSAASQYITGIANLAAKNAIAGFCTAGAITTALVYTFIAKPIETVHKSCCSTKTNESDAIEEAPYNRI